MLGKAPICVTKVRPEFILRKREMTEAKEYIIDNDDMIVDMIG